ncbi:MAG: hypothetical protein JNK05_40495 [Myxococcales bacterium]|nr:hypothetical protein [Myxococcales bacterium]
MLFARKLGLILGVAIGSLSAACGPQTVTPDASGDSGGDGSGSDAATDAPADATPGDGSCEASPAIIHSFNPGTLYVRAGATVPLQLRLRRDPRLCPMHFTVTSMNDAVARPMAAEMTFPMNTGAMDIQVTAGTTPGRTKIRVRQSDPITSPGEAEVDVVVLAADRPACPAGTTANGMLRPGARVGGTAGSPLANASISAPMTATTIPATPVTVGCAADQVPMGFEAIGPAVSFGPSLRKFAREIPITLPVNPALVRPRYELQIEVSYTAPGLRGARVVPVANLRFTPDGSAITFDTPRMGTYQAVIRQNLGARTVRRRFTYRAIMGVSMGAIGTSVLGTRYADKFDYIGPMGGPADWAWFGQYFRDFHLGGFCTEDERMRMGAACDRASMDRTPTPDDLWAVDQTFEFWNYPDGRGGQGGTFHRESYSNIFRDLSRMFGNAVVQTSANSPLPLGVPASEFMRTDAQRCMTPVRVGDPMSANDRYYDDEYNPDGRYPVITFCDGNRTSEHAGEWAGGQGTQPFWLTLAVDRNGNGVRDFGEPVIRNFTEPFSDFGTDGVASAMEPGYNADTNPDPAGDDYDRQFNPGGTERNYVRDEGEPYRDVGLDGVACPMGRTCPYDQGEGNGRFDTTSGVARFIERNPRSALARLSATDASRLGVWADGGTRDLFNFGTVANHFVGATAQTGQGLHYYNNFLSLDPQRPIAANNDTGFEFLEVDWERLPRHAIMRYGFEDATEQMLRDGDGGHVGTVEQITSRLYSGIWRLQANWPRLNRAPSPVMNTVDDAGRCANGYSCTFDFTSMRTGRTTPLGISLPPGYHRPENAGERYPVIFLLHGYGMDAASLVAAGVLTRNYMGSAEYASWQRPGKVILVFPDGRCRGSDNCIRGTFYTDSPFSDTAQMEQNFLDIYEFVERNFRVRMPEEVDVTE